MEGTGIFVDTTSSTSVIGHFFAEASIDGTRKQHIESLVTIPLLIIDDLSMRKLSLTAAEKPLENIMRRYERASTIITSNRLLDDWGKLLGDSAALPPYSIACCVMATC
jgi:DNA replication protein DnaC